jgi:antitoxin ParD1/3/4
MAASKKRTVSLPREQASYIDRLVKSGTYSSASEVVRAGLRSLQERDAVVEHWLKNEVASAYDELQKDPRRTIPSEDVFAEVRARYADRTKKSA